ncbi:oxygen-insensitive NADPH nitroreductase [Utexia brackfieldae]|uniref:oxygen-insensitive NADPH nitroreductase n=1 Tax=Utexia brackfieldae TaxID=3074108 RepID=UPI00370D5C12
MTTSTIDLLCQHRSIRAYTDQLVSNEQINAILQSAQAVSSSNFLQCSTIIRITDPDLRKKLAELSGGQPYIFGAPEFWVFCADLNRHKQIAPELELGKAEHLLLGAVDTSIMAQNAVVAAESLGLGCVYIGGIRNKIDEVTTLLGLPQFVLPLFGLCIGYPAQDPELKPRLPKALVFFENHYQPIDKPLLAQYDETMAHYYQARSSNQKFNGWSDNVANILSAENRDFMLDYLHKQGWIKK